MSNYTLEVELADMPEGWVCFAIGEGKPVIAPPPVADEIKSLLSQLGECQQNLEYFQKAFEDANAELLETAPKLDEALRRLGRIHELSTSEIAGTKPEIALQMIFDICMDRDVDNLGECGGCERKIPANATSCPHCGITFATAPDRRGEYGACGNCGAALHSVEDHHRHVMGECVPDNQDPERR